MASLKVLFLVAAAASLGSSRPQFLRAVQVPFDAHHGTPVFVRSHVPATLPQNGVRGVHVPIRVAHAPTTVVGTVNAEYAAPETVRAVAVEPAVTTRYAAPETVRAVEVPEYVAPSAVRAVEEVEVVDANPQYSFGYSVSDTVSGDAKTREEARDGDVVKGSYSVADPDGRLRRVEYTADKEHGFRATVTYDGKSGPVAIPQESQQQTQQAVLSVPTLAAVEPIDDDVTLVEARTNQAAETAETRQATLFPNAPLVRTDLLPAAPVNVGHHIVRTQNQHFPVQVPFNSLGQQHFIRLADGQFLAAGNHHGFVQALPVGTRLIHA